MRRRRGLVAARAANVRAIARIRKRGREQIFYIAEQQEMRYHYWL